EPPLGCRDSTSELLGAAGRFLGRRQSQIETAFLSLYAVTRSAAKHVSEAKSPVVPERPEEPGAQGHRRLIRG
ncbi:MAG TPA: hypothetical protein PK710_24295, partial [Polyangiaceae bacterium]|nr:hypothetical protein [Polyangiaceae bacterium]